MNLRGIFKGLLLTTTMMLAVFFVTDQVLAGRNHDNVPGHECEHGQHTNNPHCDYDDDQSPTATPSATLSPTEVPSVTPTETPEPIVTETPKNEPGPKGPPEWENPCYYLRDHEECKPKSEVFPGEDEQFGPNK